MKYIDLFAGIGGFRLGIERATAQVSFPSKRQKKIGGARIRYPETDSQVRHSRQPQATCVYTNEWDKYATQIYEKNFKTKVDTRDITTVRTNEIPDHDLLCAGFPCQAFSVAGKRLGFNDTRGTLFFEIARILKHHKPMYALLENVKGLISHNEGKTLETILETLQQLGYYVNWEVYNSKDYGVPQNRERIFFICKHLKGLTSVGQNKKMGSYESLIQDYLFQLLLNNLKEVQKLQEHASKDWVVGYLLSKEINQNLKSNEGNTKGGITIPMVESIFQSKVEEVWQNIGTWLSNNLGVDCSEPSISTIPTVIKKTTELKIYSFSQMQEYIWLATAVLRKLQPSLWKEILSSLILIQEGTKYARINNQTEKAVITEYGTAHLTENFQDFGECFVEQHLRGTSRPKVFLISGGGQPNESTMVLAHTLNSSDWRGANRNQQQTTIRHPLKFLERNQRNIEGDYAFTVDGANTGGVKQGMQIRRLTPLEAERLQGFPDGWTEGVSDTQKYKMLGNAVTVNVVEEVFKRLFLETTEALLEDDV